MQQLRIFAVLASTTLILACSGNSPNTEDDTHSSGADDSTSHAGGTGGQATDGGAGGQGGVGGVGGQDGTGGDASGGAGAGGAGGGGTGGSQPDGRTGFVLAFAGDPGLAIARLRETEVNYCTDESNDGVCYRQTCSGSAVVPGSVNGGAITITGGVSPVTVSYGLSDYHHEWVPGGIFQGNEPLTFTIPGGTEIPPMSATLEAPATATLTAPSLNALVIQRSQPLDIVWTHPPLATALGTVTIGLMYDLGSGDRHRLVCSFPATDGMGTIPAAMLSQLSPATQVTIHVQSSTQTLQEDGEWSVGFAAIADMLSNSSPSGFAQADDVRLQ